MNKIILLGLLTLTGCATSSGVLKTGANAYTVSASASLGGGGGSTAKKNAYLEANQECGKQGKSIDITNEKVSVPSWTDGMYTVDISFKCV